MSAKKGQSQSEASSVVETMTLYCFDLLLAAVANYREGCVPTWPTHSTTRTNIKPKTHASKIRKDASCCLHFATDIITESNDVVTAKNHQNVVDEASVILVTSRRCY